MLPADKCPVCASPATVKQVYPGPREISCFRCGPFSVVHLALGNLNDLTPSKKTLLSAYIYENPNIQFDQKLLNELEETMQVPPVRVRADKLLSYLARRHPQIAENLQISSYALIEEYEMVSWLLQEHKEWDPENTGEAVRHHLRLLSATSSESKREIRYLLSDILVNELGLISFHKDAYRITPKGWDYISSMKKNPLSSFGFVAMSFSPDLSFLYDNAIKIGIEQAGYNPIRIDRHQHLNRIDDEIIAMIRRARFCVADLTMQNDGAYFEAGYALGFGIPVVWTCREKEKAHFDTRQFNTIMWEKEKLPDLIKSLQFRIERVIGRGPNSIADR